VQGLATLQELCAAARVLYRKEHRLDLFCEWIQDVGTAQLLLAWAVGRYAQSTERYTWTTWLDAAPISLGQRVSLTHPLIPNYQTLIGEVLEWHFNPGQMAAPLQLTMRTATLLPILPLTCTLDLVLDDVTLDLLLVPEDPCAGTDYTTNLMAHWLLDEASGDRLDSVGGYTLHEWNSVTSRSGLLGNAAVFTGDGAFSSATKTVLMNSSTYINHDHAADLVLTSSDSFTVTFWVQFDDLVTINQQGLVSISNFQIRRVSNNIFFDLRTTGSVGSSASASHSFSVGPWLFVAAIYDTSGGGQLFLKINDGGFVGPTTPATAPGSPDLGITFGQNPTGGSQFLGALDDVALWVGRVLTLDELDCIYNGGAGRVL
jgi:hypothetical protein